MEIEPKVNPLPTPGEIREIDGVKYKWTDTGFTVAGYFCHDGPGWDFRNWLLDSEWALSHVGRTFTPAEVYGDVLKTFPDSSYYDWEEIVEE